ncbi:hypothetical protein [Falsiroseomonas tokyonensis]|uniref:Uncharacterized protein n=1 Tax=Falsiroseomonas tokyonensis TaxID=430521 RepID=A0ABV7C5L1_9PROT|nr:hypothetical protein [Falsiroseomonas tokyonensis]MBU8541933.1 hypothetical protein [Falsiroseomonas tokyonensis]
MSFVPALDPEVLRRMREIIVTSIATRSASLREAAAEARDLARGLCPRLSTAALNEAVTTLLIELGAHAPPAPPDLDGQGLRPADPAEVADSLAFALRFDERGKARRTGVEYTSKIAAEQLVQRLLASGLRPARRLFNRQREARILRERHVKYGRFFPVLSWVDREDWSGRLPHSRP